MFDDMDITEQLPKGFYIEEDLVGSINGFVIVYSMQLFRKRIFRKPELIFTFSTIDHPTYEKRRNMKLQLLSKALEIV